MKSKLTQTQLNNIRNNYLIIMRVIRDELSTELHQNLNRLAYRLSMAETDSTEENLNLADNLTNDVFERYFSQELNQPGPSEQRISREFWRLLKEHQNTTSYYDLDTTTGRAAILSDLIKALGCFPTCWNKTSRTPSFPSSELSSIDDVLYVDCGPQKPKRTLGFRGLKIQHEFEIGKFLKEIMTERMAFLLPVLTVTEQGEDAAYWQGGIFPVTPTESIRVEFLNEFLKNQNSKGETLAQRMKLTCDSNGNESETHTLWFSRLPITDERPFNLDAPSRNFFRWLFKLLLLNKEKGRVHCSSSIGRTGAVCWSLKSYELFLQLANYKLVKRFLFGESLTLNECKKIAAVFIDSLNTLRQIRPFIQSDHQLFGTPPQLFIMLAEEFKTLTHQDIETLKSIFVEPRTPETKLIFHQVASLANPATASEDDDDITKGKEPSAESSEEKKAFRTRRLKVSEKYLKNDGTRALQYQGGHTVWIIPERFSVAQFFGTQLPGEVREDNPNIPSLTLTTTAQHRNFWGGWSAFFRGCCCCRRGNLAQVADETSLSEKQPNTVIAKPTW